MKKLSLILACIGCFSGASFAQKGVTKQSATAVKAQPQATEQHAPAQPVKAQAQTAAPMPSTTTTATTSMRAGSPASSTPPSLKTGTEAPKPFVKPARLAKPTTVTEGKANGVK